MTDQREGACELCGESSEDLQRITAWEPPDGPIMAWACPSCRKAIEWIRGERGEREAHQEGPT